MGIQSKNVEYRARGPNDCWNLLSKQDKKQFRDAVSRADKILGYYPFDFIMRIRLQFLRGHFEPIPAFLEYLLFGTRKHLKKLFNKHD